MEVPNVYVLIFCLFPSFSISLDDTEHEGQAISLKGDTFNDALSSKRHFVMFYAPWCGHCKRLGPTWDELAALYNKMEDSPVTIAKVDCTVDTPLCAEHEVTGYPTLKYFYEGLTDFVRFKGSRDLESFKKFLEEQHQPEEEESAPPAPKKGLLVLDKDMDEVVKFGNYFIKFYAPWCGHCQRLAPVWEELATIYEFNEDVTIAKIDCQEFGSVCSKYSISGYPTLIYFSNGKQVESFTGGRTLEDLKHFVNRMITREEENVEGTEEKVPDEIEREPDMIELTDQTYEEFISAPVIFVKYYAPWCGHCKKLAPTWLDLSKKFSDNEDVIIADIDCTKYQYICKDNQVKGYPTLVLFRNGVRVKEYDGSRTLDNLVEFVASSIIERDEL